jgi:RNA polymerase sigma factor (sigma-70 family)
MPMADAGAEGVTTAERSAAREWTDQQLLNGYTRGSERDFADLVSRHAGWVYSAAKRRVRDPALAEDVTQAVFVVLARKARSLRGRATLEPWLFKVLKYTASVALRSARNRRHHEREAAAVYERQHRTAERTTAAAAERAPFIDTDEGTWSGLESVLDDVLGQLSLKDRQAVLLRFYQRKTYADVGRAIRTSEDGARKRVDRALEKLRTLFRRRGVGVGSVQAFGAAIFANTTTAGSAPVGFAAQAAAAALAAAKALAAGTAVAAPGAVVAALFAKQAMKAIASVKAAVVGTASVAGAVVVTVTVYVAVAMGPFQWGSGAAGGGAPPTQGTATATRRLAATRPATTRTAPASRPAGGFYGIAPPSTAQFAAATGQREPATPPSELSRRAVPVPDAANSPRIASGWPLALPGEVNTTPTVADLDGDGTPEVFVVARRVDAVQQVVHPEPSWANQLFAFSADGRTLSDFPIELSKPFVTPNGVGGSSSPSVYLDGSGNAHLVVCVSLAGDTCVVHPDRSVTRIAGGDPSMNVPLADLDGDGVPDLVGAGLQSNVLGGGIADWKRPSRLGGFGTAVGDVDGDGSPEVFRPSHPLNEDSESALFGGFNRRGAKFGAWPVTTPLPNYFPPVLADLDGDGKREVIAAYGDSVYVWNHDGTPAPGTTRGAADPRFNAVFQAGVNAWQASPALADLDTDGKPEIVVVDQATQTLRAWRGDRRGANGQPDGIIASLPSPSAGVSVVDLGGDGVIDFFTGTHWVKWDRTGRQPTTVTNMITSASAVNFVQPTVADVDRDGRMEVIFALRDGRLFVYRTELPCAAADMQWPTANGSFAHTGTWPPSPVMTLRRKN